MRMCFVKIVYGLFRVTLRVHALNSLSTYYSFTQCTFQALQLSVLLFFRRSDLFIFGILCSRIYRHSTRSLLASHFRPTELVRAKQQRNAARSHTDFFSAENRTNNKYQWNFTYENTNEIHARFASTHRQQEANARAHGMCSLLSVRLCRGGLHVYGSVKWMQRFCQSDNIVIIACARIAYASHSGAVRCCCCCCWSRCCRGYRRFCCCHLYRIFAIQSCFVMVFVMLLYRCV